MMLLLTVACIFLTQRLATSQDGNPTAVTKNGKFEGVALADFSGVKINAYLGIPFAKPPTGSLRFKAPEEYPKHEGVFKAVARSKACVQFTKLVEPWIPIKEDTSEDCLYLNIWVTDRASGNLPVIFFLHGGGFEAGSANWDSYDGKTLAAKQNVVFVSANYRLSALGFLFLDEQEAPGNVGLMDQALALKWIQKNIASFGGDPNRVTVVGQSAGARSAGCHLSIPSSQELFQRVVLLSGTSTTVMPLAHKTLSRYKALKLADDLGCKKGHSHELVRCLRNAEVEDLVNATLLVSDNSFLPFAPVVDGKYLRLSSKKALKTFLNSSIDIMLGTLSGDGSFWVEYFFPEAKQSGTVSVDQLEGLIKTAVGRGNDLAAKFVKYLYTDWEDQKNPEKRRKSLLDLATDYFYVCPLTYTADVAAENGNNVYRYWLDSRSPSSSYPDWMEMVHGDELSHFFGIPLDKTGPFSDEDRYLTKSFMGFLTSFAAYGDPNLQSAHDLKWPKYSVSNQEYLGFSPKAVVGHSLRGRHCEFWNGLLPSLLSEGGPQKEDCDSENNK